MLTEPWRGCNRGMTLGTISELEAKNRCNVVRSFQ
ncbi:hypothetical protein MJC1_01330 [Methylocystis sp. MJC1]|nr:hypothetical protein MJC1_01330 [Methylocystis sp. MJC1]